MTLGLSYMYKHQSQQMIIEWYTALWLAGFLLLHTNDHLDLKQRWKNKFVKMFNLANNVLKLKSKMHIYKHFRILKKELSICSCLNILEITNHTQFKFILISYIYTYMTTYNIHLKEEKYITKMILGRWQKIQKWYWEDGKRPSRPEMAVPYLNLNYAFTTPT